jgi:hypothetical protein
MAICGQIIDEDVPEKLVSAVNKGNVIVAELIFEGETAGQAATQADIDWWHDEYTQENVIVIKAENEIWQPILSNEGTPHFAFIDEKFRWVDNTWESLQIGAGYD